MTGISDLLGNSLDAGAAAEVNQINFASITNAFNTYVVSPLNAFGLGGFIFDIEGDAVTNLEAEITDHYTEDNTTIQDNIAIRPVRVILTNYVGELVYRRDNTTNTPIQQLTQKLTVLNSYLPGLTPGAEQAYNILSGNASLPSPDVLASLSAPNIGSTITNTANIYGMVQNLLPPTTKQQQAYQYFKALWQQKILFAIQTPHEFLTNMAIESVRAHQPEDTKDISDFTLTLKQLRFASAQFVPYAPTQQASGATALQSQATQVSSNVQGPVLDSSVNASSVYNAGGL